MFLNKWQFSRLAFGVGWVLVFALLPIFRMILKSRLLRYGLWQIPVRLIGSGPNAQEAWLALRSERLMGYQLQEVVVPPGGPDPAWATVTTLQWEQGLQALNREPNHQVVIALEPDQQDAFDGVLRQVSKLCPHVLIVPPTRGLPLFGMEPLHAFSHEVLLLRAHNNLLRPSARILKRAFDIVVSVLLLTLLAPLFAWLVLKVRQTDGPAFFGHQRISLQGQAFPCYKFRTMVTNSAEVLERLLREDPEAREQWEREFKLKTDPRITPIGDLLRRTSLDELPQLWNVLRGEMSLVGPRPVIRDELEKYGEDVSYYLQVRPGMTGLWQVSGRNDVDYETRVALDAWYVRNWSLWNDIVILLKTVRVVLARDGAY
jgi:Undecaprenyl-phosphate galactose phosphotransferase WbaP